MYSKRSCLVYDRAVQLSSGSVKVHMFRQHRGYLYTAAADVLDHTSIGGLSLGVA